MMATDEQRALWHRLQAHPLDRVTVRLQRDEGWTRSDALDAVEEYRRFVFLACTGSTQVTPSEAVDAAWHAHLLHTRDYWDVFCAEVLRQPLHHEPGGLGERTRHDAQYLDTRLRYEAAFGTPPPARWWPRRAVAPRSRNGERVAALIAASVPAVAYAATRPANPLDWNGPDFLVLYVLLMVVVIVACRLWRGALRRGRETVRDAGPVSMLETAYLAGGPGRAIDAAVAALHARGAVLWNATVKRFEKKPGTRPVLPEELAMFENALTSGSSAKAAVKLAEKGTHRVRADLERRGMWQPREVAQQIGRLTSVPLWLLLAFGVAKIGIGLQRERPVTMLAILCVVVAVFALVQWFGGRSVPTRAGRLVLERERTAHRASGKGRGDLGLAVALGGTLLLADTALADYHRMRAPPGDSGSSSSGDSSSSSDSSSDGGGSSCGGCGGGGGD